MKEFIFEHPQYGKIGIPAETEEDAAGQLNAWHMQQQNQAALAAPPQPSVPATPKLPNARKKIAEMDVDPTYGMNGFYKGVVGAGAGLRNMYLGGKNLVGLGTEDERDERKLYDKYKDTLGWQGMVGEGISEAAVTAPLGGPLAATGKVLGKAVPWAAKVGGWGSRVVNPGTVVKAVGEGALSAGIKGDADDRDIRDRLDDVVEGGAWGGATNLGAGVATGVVKGAKGAWHALGPTKAAAEHRAANAFQKTFDRAYGGKEGGTEAMDAVLRAQRDAGDRMLPHTIASLSGNPTLGALERGAQGRGNVDWKSLRERQARAAWNSLGDIPRGARTEAGKMLDEKFLRGGVPMTRDVVGDVVTGRVPVLEDRPLREALGKLKNGLSDTELTKGMDVADEIRMIEGALKAPGASQPSKSSWAKVASDALAFGSAAKGSPELWKIRSILNSFTGGAHDKTLRSFDEALADPDKFAALIEKMRAKTDAGRPLSTGEDLVKRAIEAYGRQLAVPSKEETE